MEVDLAARLSSIMTAATAWQAAHIRSDTGGMAPRYFQQDNVVSFAFLCVIAHTGTTLIFITRIQPASLHPVSRCNITIPTR